MKVMGRELTVEEAIERAKRAQESRIEAIRSLAEARQSIVNVREQAARELAELKAKVSERIADAERHDLKAYNAAQTAGWSNDELRRIGFPEPAKKTRVRRHTTRRASQAGAASSPTETPTADEGYVTP